MSVTNLGSYQELDDDTKSKYAIDDIWDDATRTFKQKKLFQVSRVSGNIVLTVNKNEADCFRFVCTDPRVGCILYKMHILNAQDATAINPKKEDIGVEKNNASKSNVTKVYTTDYFYKEQVKYSNTVYARRLRIRGVPISFQNTIYKAPSVQCVRSLQKP